MNFDSQVKSVEFARGRCMQLDPSAFVADTELLEALARRATPITCESDRVLFRQGDHPVGLYILHSGKALLSMVSPSGEPILSFETGSGSLLGLPGVVSDQPFTLTAIARAGAEVGFLSHDQFKAFMQTFPLMAFKILQVLAAEVSAARRAIVP
jgi:CRP/FNR family transcriptional regulator, cyclic AMP receptor protein